MVEYSRTTTNASWQLLWELPYCQVCGTYTFPHFHETKRPAITTASAPPSADLVMLRCTAKSTPEEVRAAFRVIIKEVHPDLGGSEADTKRIIAAYDRLKAQGRAV